MKLTLGSAHLFRHFLLFFMTVLFLLTMTRAAYGLWQFPRLEQTDAFVPFFVQGLRFDIALIGVVCLIPVVVGSLLSMMSATRPIARAMILLFLFGGLAVILLMELITPWFIQSQGLRPDPDILASIDQPTVVLREVLSQHVIPAVIAGVLVILILVAFWSRLEVRRFLRYRTSVMAGTVTAVLGGVLCALAIWSAPDIRQPPLGPPDAVISTDNTVNDLVMNTTYKGLYSLLMPYLNPPD